MVGPEWDDSLFAIVNTGEQDAHSTEDCVEWSDIVRTSAMVLTGCPHNWFYLLIGQPEA